MNLELADLLVTASGVLLLIAFWYLLWKPYAVTRLRQDLMDARDDLFDLVADRQTSLGFDAPVYRGTREDLNSMIRYAHEISIFIGVCSRLLMHEAVPIYRARTERLHSNLTDDERKLIAQINHKQSVALTRFFLLSSMLVWCGIALVALVVPFIMVFRLCYDGARVFRSVFKTLVFTPAIENAELESGQRYLFGKPSDRARAAHLYAI